MTLDVYPPVSPSQIRAEVDLARKPLAARVDRMQHQIWLEAVD
jgi:hypothetical protein